MVPAGLLTFGLDADFDADFGGLLLFEQVQGQVSHHRQVLVGVAGSDSAAVFIKGQVDGGLDGAPLVALAEDFEEQFRTGEDRGTKPGSSMMSSLRRANCRCRLSSLRSSRASMSSCNSAAAVVKPTDIPFRQAARPNPRAMWVLPAPPLPVAMTFS